MKLELLQLEDRICPSVDITTLGGPTIPHAKVNIIAPDNITPFVASVVTDYLPIMQSYYGVGQGSVNSVVPLHVFNSNPSNLQIQQFLTNAIHSGLEPANDSSSIYLIQLDPGQFVTDPWAKNFAGYHSVFILDGKPVYYAVCYNINEENNQIIISHEIAEATTDPDTQTGYKDHSTGLEVCDVYDFAVDNYNNYSFNVISGPHGEQLTIPVKQTQTQIQSSQNPLIDLIFEDIQLITDLRIMVVSHDINYLSKVLNDFNILTHNPECFTPQGLTILNTLNNV